MVVGAETEVGKIHRERDHLSLMDRSYEKAEALQYIEKGNVEGVSGSR